MYWPPLTEKIWPLMTEDFGVGEELDHPGHLVRLAEPADGDLGVLAGEFALQCLPRHGLHGRAFGQADVDLSCGRS
jgi:hypothetical protein